MKGRIKIMSKELRELFDSLRAAQSKAKNLMVKDNVTEEELKTVTTEIDTINAKIDMQKSLDAGKTFDENGAEVTATVKPKDVVTDKFSTLEYRNAFREYCLTGKMSPEIKNLDATTTTGDAAAIIPSTILQEVIKKVQSYGQLFAKVRKLSIKGGVTVPILALKPTATWIGETTTSARQKVDLSGKISFSYYGLECKISSSLLTDTTTLALFESTLIDLIGEAMTKALDIAIVKGEGTSSPLGIVNDTRIPEAQVVTLSSAEFAKWDSWKKKVFAKMPLAYKGGASFAMASGTFEGYIDGMVDASGQPIGRINYGTTEGPQERFGGKPVIEVEDDIISPYDDAATGDVVAIYCNLNNYGINSNMQLQMYRYLDQDKNEYVDKAILIADGKLIDPNGVVIVKKGA